MPEFFYWDGYTPMSLGCTDGGVFDFDMDNTGTKYRFNFERCAFTKNFRMTGWGRYNIELDRFVLKVKTTGRWSCNVQYVRRGEHIHISGKGNGKPVKAKLADVDQHQMPDLHVSKHD